MGTTLGPVATPIGPPIGPMLATPPVKVGLIPTGGPPITLGGPTGVTTPGLAWIPGVMESASITGDTGATTGLRIGAGAITGGGATIGAVGVG